eukprot:TRINITY_DN63568_c0_g1_i1.p1 TRINITY_DN63568_c0_g1~~TRINITY_DN63568_c0_g1_i1.p1  ORF type:complete len:486 (-),score=87.46 TRINITY_DN63568_c0_g1_i1:312-1769(-)
MIVLTNVPFHSDFCIEFFSACFSSACLLDMSSTEAVREAHIDDGAFKLDSSCEPEKPEQHHEACDGIKIDVEVDAELAKGSVPSVERQSEENLPPQRLVLVVMICVIQGYTLIGPLQHSFKVAMGISDASKVGVAFTQAAALVQWGKFAMTLGQNFIFCKVKPIHRVYIAMVGMMLGCLIPPLFVYRLGSLWIGWVFLSFGLIGLSLGVFECTFLNVITPLGPLTKSWAIMGFPAAFAIINVIGFTFVSFGMPEETLFWYVFCCMPFGMLVFYRKLVPELGERLDVTATTKKQERIWTSIKDAPTWFPSCVPFVFVNIVGHFVMEGALPANFNTFNDDVVPLYGRTDNHLMDKHRFFVVFFVFVGLGDMLSRRFGYWLKLDTYLANSVALCVGPACSVIGLYTTTLGIGVVSWVSAFLAFWGQGLNYAIASRYIDRCIPREHNLAAYSLWMFAGSAGAIAGSTMVDVIREWICHGDVYPHECLAG